MTSPASSMGTRGTLEFTYSYTVGLLVVALVSLSLFGAHAYLIPATLPADSILTSPFLSFFYLMVALCSGMVALLRIYRSRVARFATVALNALWILWFGVGTGMFIWWICSVRKRERPASLSPASPDDISDS